MRKIIFLLLLSLILSINASAEIRINGKKKLLLLGDSMTYGTGDSTGNVMGYRDHLQDFLGSSYVIVGTIRDPYSATGYSTWHDGIPSNNTSDTEDRTLFALSKTMVNDVPSGSGVILDIGTNDASRTAGSVPGYSTAGTVANIEDIFDIIRTYNTNIIVYVSNLGKNNDSSKEAEMLNINAALTTMINAYRISYPLFTIVYVDMHTMSANDTWNYCSGNFLTNCLSDVTHPNDTGYRAMARQWYECISNPSGTNCS